MGELIRNIDWSKTSLGVPDTWPRSFRSTLGILLHSAFPTFLVWGRDELICFYNDAYRPSLGNQGVHPAIGKAYPEVWPEVWAFVGPLFRRVLDSGETIYFENQLVPIERNGKLDDAYWTFSYSPAFDDTDGINGIFVTCVETTREVRARQALELSQERYQNLMASAPVAIALFRGPQFIIELANERVLEYWGRQREQVINKPLFEALPEASGQGFEALLTGVYTTGKPFVAKELTVTLERNGQLAPTYIDFVYEPFYETDGSISGVVVVCTEITEQVLARKMVEASEARYRTLSEELERQVQERTEQLEAANEELAANNEELEANNEEYAAINEELEESNDLLVRSNDNLQQFAYVASHDLQEPLRKIQQFGDLLKARQTSLSGDDLVYIDRMQLAASRMSTLIRDLLNFSRISTQQASSQPVVLNQIVDQVLTTLELVISETNAEVRVEPLPTIQGDASQLAQLFQNLISNALKFRRPSVIPIIQIQVQTLNESELPSSIKPMRVAKTYYRIDVVDNGIGFDEKYLDRIFQVFQRLHGKSEVAGTGIGLAICERVVANHGGVITATSQLGQGATFSVYLPVPV